MFKVKVFFCFVGDATGVLRLVQLVPSAYMKISTAPRQKAWGVQGFGRTLKAECVFSSFYVLRYETWPGI